MIGTKTIAELPSGSYPKSSAPSVEVRPLNGVSGGTAPKSTSGVDALPARAVAAASVAPEPARPAGTADADKANSALQLAKGYLDSGMKDKAVTMLKDVVAKYPGTDAAKEAQKLLDASK